ncbi:DNA polymerase delta small subunit [Morus notabilis]|uniref:DNA polymerase delta small subunit n=1 Tax=Morus notabilis TaxID=981085 RepID=W9S229_9ROSA|nr:DNA polymerase delta small subunit [Morus notabilis]
MPGSDDPANFSLPQQPLNRYLFPGSSAYNTFRSCTNPHCFELDNIRFLGTSGQNIDDLEKYSKAKDKLEFMERTLKWRHLAPTAPNTLGCYPFTDMDPFLIEICPHVYFVGNQDKYDTRLLTAEHEKSRMPCSQFWDSIYIMTWCPMETTEGGSVARPPLLDGLNYSYWKAFIKAQDEKVTISSPRHRRLMQRFKLKDSVPCQDWAQFLDLSHAQKTCVGYDLVGHSARRKVFLLQSWQGFISEVVVAPKVSLWTPPRRRHCRCPHEDASHAPRDSFVTKDTSHALGDSLYVRRTFPCSMEVECVKCSNNDYLAKNESRRSEAGKPPDAGALEGNNSYKPLASSLQKSQNTLFDPSELVYKLHSKFLWLFWDFENPPRGWTPPRSIPPENCKTSPADIRSQRQPVLIL